jgi:hypothetical protein
MVSTILALVSTSGNALAQGQYPMQPPPAQMGPPPGAPPSGPAQQPQRPLEYAYRPDLSNPEFGECLQLEKRWQSLWQSYAQAYQTATSMTPRHPQYQQQASYVNSLKAQLDAAWNAFSKCIYFPPERRR